jgi:hypothetical protein
LADPASQLKDEASLLPADKPREELLKKARQLKVAAHVNEWLQSPELQPPRQRYGWLP